MRSCTVMIASALVVSIVSIAPTTAQQKSEPYFKDGVIKFDQKKFKQDFDQQERDAANPDRAARSLRKNELASSSTTERASTAVRCYPANPDVWCAAQGHPALFNNTGRVDFGKCP